MAIITDEDFAIGTYLVGFSEVVPGLHHEAGRVVSGYEEPR